MIGVFLSRPRFTPYENQEDAVCMERRFT